MQKTQCNEKCVVKNNISSSHFSILILQKMHLSIVYVQEKLILFLSRQTVGRNFKWSCSRIFSSRLLLEMFFLFNPFVYFL